MVYYPARYMVCNIYMSLECGLYYPPRTLISFDCNRFHTQSSKPQEETSVYRQQRAIYLFPPRLYHYDDTQNWNNTDGLDFPAFTLPCIGSKGPEYPSCQSTKFRSFHETTTTRWHIYHLSREPSIFLLSQYKCWHPTAVYASRNWYWELRSLGTSFRREQLQHVS